MGASAARLDLDRLAIGAFVVVVAVFVAMRALGVEPWAWPAYDVYAYWVTREGIDYSVARQGVTGTFLYSPAFAQVIAPLTVLPWTLFAALWTAIIAAPLLWLAGRYAIVLLLLPPVAMSAVLGQLDLAFAAVAVAGLRWPAVWALPILTKVTPGIGLLWFLVRREWRHLAIAGAATAGVVLVSAAAAPADWAGWLAMLRRADFPELGNGLWFLPVPLWLRLLLAAALIAWGAPRDRRWVLPVAMCMALPTVWVNSPTILVAVLPLVARGALTPASAWLRSGPLSPGITVLWRRLVTALRRVTA